jgi:hypothetical protein
MAFQISKGPGSWAVYCPDDSFNFCDGLSINDFDVTWNVSAFGDTLISIQVEPSANGLVSSILTKPNGTVENLTTASTSPMNYSSGDDRWKPTTEFNLTDQVFYRFSVTVNVSLKTGDNCNFVIFSDFQYIDLGSLPTASPTITGIQQVGNTLTGADGYYDADGDAQDTGATIRRWYSYSDAAGTVDETYLGAGSTYLLTSSEAQRYIRYKVIPYAVSGPSPGVEGSSPVFGIIAPDTIAAEIVTNNAGTFALTQTVSTTSAIGIDWGDGTDLEVTAQSTGVDLFTHAFPAGSKTITIYARPSDITEIDINTQEVTSIDITNLTHIASLIAGQNSNLSSVTLPTGNSVTWSDLQLNNCALSGNFDMSAISMPASTLLQNNTSLTMITFPSTGMCTQFRADNCDLTGTIDFSGIDLYGNIQVQSNSNLTGITFGTSSGATSNFQAFNCGLTGTLDYSALDCTGSIVISGNSLTGITYTSTAAGVILTCGLNDFTSLDISGYTGIVSFNCSTCTSLTTLTLPASSGSIYDMRMQACDLPYVDFTNLTFASNVDFRMFNNSMTAAEVNCVLEDLDATFPNSGTGKIRIEGTNAAPDGSAGGCNGTAAAANLASEGYNVTTS